MKAMMSILQELRKQNETQPLETILEITLVPYKNVLQKHACTQISPTNALLSRREEIKRMKKTTSESSESVRKGRLVRFPSRKHSVLGEMLRSSAPPWVEYLLDSGMSLDEEKKKRAAANECGLCQCSLKSARELEPANKKVCRVCKTVTCRQCAAHVHVLGHLRRRYVCFKCVGEACTQTKLVPPVIVEKIVEGQSPKAVPVSTLTQEQREAREESVLASFVSRLWDTWSGWSGQREEAISEGEESQEETSTPNLATKASSDSGVDKMEQLAQMLEESGGKFDGESLKNLLQLSHGFKGDGHLVLAVPFTKACMEVIKLMAGLGKAFEFAGSDMNDKLRAMEKRTAETAAEAKCPLNEVTLQMMIEREIRLKTTHAGKKAAGATRTIVRLLWFLDFISVLLTKLGNEPKESLSKILAATYEETLGPRHVWVLRRIVRSGMGMAPGKDVFLPRLGVENLSEQEQCAKFKDWAKTIDEVRADMWKFIEGKGLADVP